MDYKTSTVFIFSSFGATTGCVLLYWLRKVRGTMLMACWATTCLVLFWLNSFFQFWGDGEVRLIINMIAIISLMILFGLVRNKDIDNGWTDLVVGVSSLSLYPVVQLNQNRLVKDFVMHDISVGFALSFVVLNIFVYAAVPLLIRQRQRLIYSISPVDGGFIYYDRMILVEINNGNVKKIYRHRGILFNRIIIDGNFVVRHTAFFRIKSKRVLLIERKGFDMSHAKRLLSIGQ